MINHTQPYMARAIKSKKRKLERCKMAERVKDTNNWPEVFHGLYDRLNGSNAEIAYNFDDFEIDVPSSTSENAPHAHWKFNGTMRITTRNRSSN